MALSKAQLAENYGRLPLSFEANRGQVTESVRFLARGQGYALYLTAGGAVLALHKPESGSPRRGRFGRSPEILGLGTHGEAAAAKRPEEMVHMQLAGANPAVQPSGESPLPGSSNYLVGKNSAKWHTGVPTFAKVRYGGVYPGVDLIYYGNQRQLEYDFVVAPGADANLIRLRFDGANSVKLDGEGDLVIAAGEGAVEFRKPLVYQFVGGMRRPVEGSFRLQGINTAGFELGAYDRTKPLVIDPVLSYSTYLGGSSQDYAESIAVDAAGNAYVTGLTWSVDFPLTAGAVDAVNYASSVNSVSTAFICKFNPSGTALMYSTYLGGDGSATTQFAQGDFGHSIAVDAAGNAYITGWTYSSNFPVTSNAYQRTNWAAENAQATGFVSKLNPNGTGLVYSTYLGGSNMDEPTALALDSSGNVYTTGFTFSKNYPVTSSAFQTGNHSSGGWNAFVSKLNTTGSDLVYSTYLGGSGEAANIINTLYVTMGIAVDKAGDAYVAGFAHSFDFPLTSGAYQSANLAYEIGGTNLTLSELNPTGTGLIYSTYLGGRSYPGDFSAGVAVDRTGNAYVTGYTYSSDFPTTPGAYQSSKVAALETAFVSKFKPMGSGLVYSTFLGGSASEDSYGLALDGSGDLYVTGKTASSNFPVTPDAYQSTNKAAASGGDTAFLTELNPAGSGLLYSTFLGGSVADGGYGVALGNNGAIYLAGYTSSADFPVTSDAPETIYHAAINTAFVAAFNVAAPTAIATVTTLQSSANPQAPGDTVRFTATVAPVSGTGIPAGNVTFLIDEVTVATVALDGTGTATYLASGLVQGGHYVLASYEGNSAYAGSGDGLTETIQFPPPAITGLLPFAATAGGAGFTLTLNGTYFYSGATVNWGATALKTTYVSETRLTALVPVSLIAAVGSAVVTVTSTGGTSAGATFTITPNNTFPLVLALVPSSRTAAGAGFMLTVNGANFAANSVVLWNGAVRETTYMGGAQLTAEISAADVATEGTNRVTVASFAPSAATTAALPLVVMSATPVATVWGGSIAVAADAGGNHLASLSGSDFVPASTMIWNKVSLPTNYVSPWQITGLITAADYTSLPAVVKVANPAGTSVSFELPQALP
jgi:Bacterial Ig-like domain (group 3)/Beta-propeller repeat